MPIAAQTRAFKTKRFSKSAKNAHIADSDLCAALKEAMAGQVVDLGGGVYKKRLNKNQHRSIILGKGKYDGFQDRGDISIWAGRQ